MYEEVNSSATVLNGLELEIAQLLQYEFSIEEDPYKNIANRLGIKAESVMDIVRDLARRGILKRIGFYLNYRSSGLQAALVGASVPRNLVNTIANRYRADGLVTHMYLRDHPIYNIWIVIKRKTINDIIKEINYLKKNYNINSIILYGEKTYKLSVKYDLKKGISRSGKFSIVPEKVPTLSERQAQVARAVRRLPLSLDPYGLIAKKLELDKNKLLNKIKLFIKNGILLDPGAVLDGRRVGFKYNIMVAVRPGDGFSYTQVCRCISQCPWTTHVVKRSVYPLDAWSELCFFMIHGSNKNMLFDYINYIINKCKIKNFIKIESLKDLKPGVVR